jgi:hypothetical protein
MGLPSNEHATPSRVQAVGVLLLPSALNPKWALVPAGITVAAVQLSACPE